MATKVFRKLHQWEAHEGAIRCAAIGPTSGQIFASGGEDARVMIWTLGQGFWGKLEVPSSSSSHKVAITNVQIRPDEYALLAGTEGGSLISFDVPKKTAVRRFAAGHMSAINCVTYHPMNPAVIASGADDCTVRLWDGGSGTQYQLIKTDHSRVTSVTFSPSGQLLATGTADGRIRIWDLVANKPLAVVGGGGHPVVSLRYSDKDLVLASAGGDSILRFWNVEDGRPVPLATSATDSGTLRAACLINDSLDVAVATSDHMKVWSVPLLPDMPPPEPPAYAAPGAPLPSYRRPGSSTTVCLDSVAVPWGAISSVWAGNIVRGGGSGSDAGAGHAAGGSGAHPYMIATALSGRALSVWGIDLGSVHPFAPTPYNPLCGHHLSFDATGGSFTEGGEGAGEGTPSGAAPGAGASPRAAPKAKKAAPVATPDKAPAPAPAPAPAAGTGLKRPAAPAAGGSATKAGGPGASASARRHAAELRELDAALLEEAQAAFAPNSSLPRSPIITAAAPPASADEDEDAGLLPPAHTAAPRPPLATAADSDNSTSYEDDFDGSVEESPVAAPSVAAAAAVPAAAAMVPVGDDEDEEDGLVRVQPKAEPRRAPLAAAAAPKLGSGGSGLDIASVLSSIAAAKASVESVVAAAQGGSQGTRAAPAPAPAAVRAAESKEDTVAPVVKEVKPQPQPPAKAAPSQPESKQAESKGDEEEEEAHPPAAVNKKSEAAPVRAGASRLGSLAPPSLVVRDAPAASGAASASPPAIIPADRLGPVGLDFAAFLPSNTARGFGMSRQIPLNASLRLMRPSSARPATAAPTAAAPAAKALSPVGEASPRSPDAVTPQPAAAGAGVAGGGPPGQWVLTALTGAGAGPKAAAAAAAARGLLQARAAALSEAAARWGGDAADPKAALNVLRNAGASDPVAVGDFIRAHRWEAGALNLDTAALLVRALVEALKAPLLPSLPVTAKQEVTKACLAGLAGVYKAFGAAAAASFEAGRAAGADLAAEDRAARAGAFLRAVQAAEAEVGPLAALPGATK